MPVYEFECNKCKQIFEVAMTIAEAAEHEVICPICNGDDVRKVFSPFSAMTSRKA